ncbi:hypothetical protein D1007_17047 [Hordeum vulgare]|nr:hypothetical protein D1007_17047 [Hordeum vulgare]
MASAAIYVSLLLTIGMVDSNSYKLLCTIAGCVSAVAPLLTYSLLDENTLPPWVMSAFNVVHCFSWCIRGTQNGIGATFSAVLLLLAWFLPDAVAPPMEEDLDLLAALINPDVVAHALFPASLAAAETQEHRRRCRPSRRRPPLRPTATETQEHWH